MAIQYFWDEELSPQETDELIDRASKEIVQRKMASPAILALEMHKPLSNVLMHLTLLVGGFIAPVIGPDLFNDLTRLLAKRENIDRLIDAIEQKDGALRSSEITHG